LTLRDAITRGLRYNLATIESGENARIARGQRLVALSKLLPQVSAGVAENVEQINLTTFGLQNVSGIPNIVGPFGYTSVSTSVSQTLLLEHMRPGQPVEVRVDAYGHKWKAHVTNLGGGTGSVFSLLPPENATGNYVKVVQRVPVRIDFDRSAGQQFNAEGLLKPGLSVEPDVRVR
jgi:hypothetical protein